MSKTKSSNKPNKKGFTLIELLAVIVVLAIVLLIAVPTILYIQNKTRKQAFFTNVSNIVNTIKPNSFNHNGIALTPTKIGVSIVYILK